jgi:ribosomal protein S18 acetylase RimI-like enzyme
MSGARFEPGRPEDGFAAARLICSTDPELYDLLSGGRFDLAEAFVAGQWRRDDCLFSHRFALVSRSETGLAGLVLGYTGVQHNCLPQNREPGTEIPADFLATRELLLGEASYLFPAVPASAYYVQNLAVAPLARRKGLGRALTEVAFAVGRREKCVTCHLDVAASNSEAVALYLGMGFEVLVETRVPKLAQRHKVGTHYRLVRPIGA